MKREKQEDNVIYVHGSEEAKKTNSERQKQHNKKNKYALVLIIVAIVFIVGFIYFICHRQYKGYKVIKVSETNYENTAHYIQFCDNLLKYTPDGVSYMDANGNTIWTAGIDMKMPVGVSSGNYAAVADLNGNVVCVFGRDGLISSVTMPYTICDVDVANQGAFAVVLESAETNYVNLYNKKGEIVYEIQTTIDKSGYPLDISISDDGKKLFTSYLNITTANVENHLAAYNFGDVGQNSNADRMVGGYKLSDEIVTKIEFLDNDTVVAFGTKTIYVYSMKEKPSEKAAIALDNEVRSIFYNKKYIGIIQDETNESGENIHRIKVYDLKGNLEFTQTLNFAYDNIYAAEDEIIISGGNNCRIYRTNGSVKFDGKLSGNILSIVPNGNNLEYVVVYNGTTEIIKLKSDASKEEMITEGEK